MATIWAQEPPSQVHLSIRDNKLSHEELLNSADWINEQVLPQQTNALQWAAKQGSSAFILDMLIDAGGDIRKAHDGTGTTPLMFASREGNTETVAHLLTKLDKDDVHAVDEHGNQALHLACLSAFAAQTVKTLVASEFMDEVSIEAANNNGNTPLHLASYYSNENAISAILEKGAQVDSMAPNKRTALMLAVIADKSSNVKALLLAGADRNLDGGQGSAISIAKERDLGNIVDILSGQEL